MITTYLDMDRLQHLPSHSIFYIQHKLDRGQNWRGRTKNLDACLLLKRGLNDYTKEKDVDVYREKVSGYFHAGNNKFILTDIAEREETSWSLLARSSDRGPASDDHCSQDQRR